MKKIAILVSLLVILGAVGAACAEEPVRIGVYLPLTGQNAFGGQLECDGILMAHDEKPEVLGRKIEVIVVDNKSDKVEAANAVVRLIEKEKVHAILGTYGSSLAMAGGEVAEKAGIPVLGTSCTNPLVTQGKKYYFRACYIDPLQGSAAAKFAMDVLGAKQAAVLKDVAQDYCVGLAAYFKRAFEAAGGEVVADLNYQSGDQDFTAQLTTIIGKKPGVLFIPSYFAEGAIIIKQVRELGGTFHIMGADAMDNPDMITIGGKDIEGFVYTTFPYAPDMPDMSEMAKTFTENWKVKFPDKDPNANSAIGYDSYMLLVDAIERAGSTDPEAITEALAKTMNWEGVTGSTTINETHDAVKPVGFKMVKDGKQVYVGAVIPEM